LPVFRRKQNTTHKQDLLGKCFSSGVDTPARLLLNKANVTEEAALSQLREAYRGTGLEVRFYPDCCTIMRWQIGCNGDDRHWSGLCRYRPRGSSCATSGGNRIKYPESPIAVKV
jgi:hypothetical protein